MIFNKLQWIFKFVNFKQEAVPVIIPMSNWIYAANDDVMYTKK